MSENQDYNSAPFYAKSQTGMSQSSDLLMSVRGLFREYNLGAEKLPVIKGIDFDLEPKESVVIVGASGSGKSTFLHLLGGIDQPTAGEVFYKGQPLHLLKDEQRAQIRNKNIGYVFQLPFLLNEFTALENVMLPCQIAGLSRAESKDLANDILGAVGLGPRTQHYPNQLSGGEMQRVALARALVLKPSVLLADEPTGSLDSKTSKVIQDLMFFLKDQMGISLVVVTHDLHFATRFDRVKKISDGQWVA